MPGIRRTPARATGVEESRDCIFDDLATSFANPLDIFGHGELALLAKFESPLRNQVGMHRHFVPVERCKELLIEFRFIGAASVSDPIQVVAKIREDLMATLDRSIQA